MVHVVVNVLPRETFVPKHINFPYSVIADIVASLCESNQWPSAFNVN